MMTRRDFVSTALALMAAPAVGQSRPPRAKRVIFLFQFGGPSQLDLFDPKPELTRFEGQELPPSIQGAGPISGLTREQKGRPIVPARFAFPRHGMSGLPLSELLPHTARIADEMAMIRTVTTDAVAHDPALLFMQTGTQLPGRPSAGSWVSYGLGSESRELPSYVVLSSKGSGDVDTQPLGSRLWGNGFLPSTHQGVPFRSAGDPVLFLGDPEGVDRSDRRAMLDAVRDLNREAHARCGDPEIETRIAQYELAFRMQASVPGLLDLKDEPKEVFRLFGADAHKPGSYAANCLLARRMAERGVRYIQLFHRGWDQHGDLPKQLRAQCRDTDQATAALVLDLKRRGLLEDTLIVWGGEFGRTAYCQGKLTKDTYGRDHHGRCFTMWMAGGGVKGGTSIGETDDFGYNVVKDPAPVRDLHATLLHLLGLDPERLVYRFQGLDQKLVGVEARPKILRSLLA